MSFESSSRVVVPTPQGPKTIGILNVVFASMMLVFFNLCGAAMLIGAPYMSKMMEGFQDQAAAQAVADRAAQVEALKAQENNPQLSPQAAAAIKQQRINLEKAPKPMQVKMNMGFELQNHPVVAGFQWADLAVGTVLNVVMLISGLQLMKLKESGRKLGVWSSVLRLVRLAIFGVIYVGVVAPIISRATIRQFEEQQKQMQAQGARGGPPMRAMSGIMAASVTGGALGTYLVAAIYPAISLWVLTRPGAKAACRPAGEDEFGPWSGAGPGPKPEPEASW